MQPSDPLSAAEASLAAASAETQWSQVDRLLEILLTPAAALGRGVVKRDAATELANRLFDQQGTSLRHLDSRLCGSLYATRSRTFSLEERLLVAQGSLRRTKAKIEEATTEHKALRAQLDIGGKELDDELKRQGALQQDLLSIYSEARKGYLGPPSPGSLSPQGSNTPQPLASSVFLGGGRGSGVPNQRAAPGAQVAPLGTVYREAPGEEVPAGSAAEAGRAAVPVPESVAASTVATAAFHQVPAGAAEPTRAAPPAFHQVAASGGSSAIPISGDRGREAQVSAVVAAAAFHQVAASGGSGDHGPEALAAAGHTSAAAPAPLSTPGPAAGPGAGHSSRWVSPSAARGRGQQHSSSNHSAKHQAPGEQAGGSASSRVRSASSRTPNSNAITKPSGNEAGSGSRPGSRQSSPSAARGRGQQHGSSNHSSSHQEQAGGSASSRVRSASSRAPNNAVAKPSSNEVGLGSRPGSLSASSRAPNSNTTKASGGEAGGPSTRRPSPNAARGRGRRRGASSNNSGMSHQAAGAAEQSSGTASGRAPNSASSTAGAGAAKAGSNEAIDDHSGSHTIKGGGGSHKSDEGGSARQPSPPRRAVALGGGGTLRSSPGRRRDGGAGAAASPGDATALTPSSPQPFSQSPPLVGSTTTYGLPSGSRQSVGTSPVVVVASPLGEITAALETPPPPQTVSQSLLSPSPALLGSVESPSTGNGIAAATTATPVSPWLGAPPLPRAMYLSDVPGASWPNRRTYGSPLGTMSAQRYPPGPYTGRPAAGVSIVAAVGGSGSVPQVAPPLLAPATASATKRDSSPGCGASSLALPLRRVVSGPSVGRTVPPAAAGAGSANTRSSSPARLRARSPVAGSMRLVPARDGTGVPPAASSSSGSVLVMQPRPEQAGSTGGITPTTSLVAPPQPRARTRSPRMSLGATTVLCQTASLSGSLVVAPGEASVASPSPPPPPAPPRRPSPLQGSSPTTGQGRVWLSRSGSEPLTGFSQVVPAFAASPAPGTTAAPWQAAAYAFSLPPPGGNDSSVDPAAGAQSPLRPGSLSRSARGGSVGGGGASPAWASPSLGNSVGGTGRATLGSTTFRTSVSTQGAPPPRPSSSTSPSGAAVWS